MEDGPTPAGLPIIPQSRDNSYLTHQKIQGKDLNAQHCVSVAGAAWFRACTLAVLKLAE